VLKGDIVLITFPFTDLSGSKLRPTVVQLLPTSSNGLRKQSLIRTSKIATLDKVLAKGLLGRLTTIELNDLNNKLKTLLQLP
jgi:mRNA interferase MazF